MDKKILIEQILIHFTFNSLVFLLSSKANDILLQFFRLTLSYLRYCVSIWLQIKIYKDYRGMVAYRGCVNKLFTYRL
jgi:hypothetical protein